MPFDGINFQSDAVLNLLRLGRERVARPGGWHQGAYQCDEAVCTLGAMGLEQRAWTEDERQAVVCLCNALPEGYASIPYYNDFPGRTQAEIVALFDRAIALRLDQLAAESLESILAI